MANENVILGAMYVPRISTEGSICIETKPIDKQPPFVAIECVLHLNRARSNHFGALKCRNIHLKKNTLCAHLFKFRIVSLGLTTRECFWHLGTSQG